MFLLCHRTLLHHRGPCFWTLPLRQTHRLPCRRTNPPFQFFPEHHRRSLFDAKRTNNHHHQWPVKMSDPDASSAAEPALPLTSPRTPLQLSFPFLREGSRVWERERKPPQPGELPSPLPTKRTRTYSAWVAHLKVLYYPHWRVNSEVCTWLLRRSSVGKSNTLWCHKWHWLMPFPAQWWHVGFSVSLVSLEWNFTSRFFFLQVLEG